MSDLCDPMDCLVHGILQARILEWVAVPFSRGSSEPRDQTQISCIAGRFCYQLSHQGSPGILEWVAYAFSRGSSRPRNRTRVSCIAGGFFTNWATREAPMDNTSYMSFSAYVVSSFIIKYYLLINSTGLNIFAVSTVCYCFPICLP